MQKKADRKSFDSDLDKCLLLQEYSIPVDVIKRAEILLPYKSYTKKYNKKRFYKQTNLNIYERLELNPCTEVIKKLRKIDDALDHVSAVTDYDEEFFKIINGRPLPHYISLYKSLKSSLNNRIRVRQIIGYKKDCILNTEINFKIEQDIYDLSLDRFTEQAKVFDKFIMEDYQKSMKLLEEGEKLNVKLDSQISELQNLGDQSFTIMSRLIGLDYKYGLQQKYGRFLYYLSPPIWRSSNRDFAHSIEIEVKGFDFGSSNAEDTFTVMFEKMRMECGSRVKPVLYFTHPHELMDIFIGMERQQMYHFCHETQLVPHIKSLKDGIRVLKEKKGEDSAVVLASIQSFKNLLSFSEEQSIRLKDQFFKVLNGFFYDNVGATEVLKLSFHLDYCFGKVFLDKSTNMDIVTMAKGIEAMYMDYCHRLDSIQSDAVRKAMQKSMDLEKRKMAKAKFAARELRMFNRLAQELLILHKVNTQKVNVQCKNIHKQKIKRNVSKPRINKKKCQSLTDEEIEYLTLFTDWTTNEDPALYLHLSTEQHDIVPLKKL